MPQPVPGQPLGFIGRVFETGRRLDHNGNWVKAVTPASAPVEAK